MTAKLPVILDNRSDNTVLNALRKLLPSLQKLDVATGVFKLRVFLALDGHWQKINKIRILMSHRTTVKRANCYGNTI